MRFVACLFIILMPALCFAQFNVTGRVLDQADSKPIPSASVFINNTTIGDKTANSGTFILENLKPGKYQLVVSVIGFEIYKQNLVVDAVNLKLPDIKMHPRVETLKEVTIKRSSNLYRDIYYNRFKDEFLGKSDLARDCKIMNPEIIDFDFDEPTNTLAASSSGFLEIRNDALGYTINYLLNDFTVSSKYMVDKDVHYDGTVLFTAMKGTPAQERRWRQRRQETYEGSTVHFLRSAMNDRLEEEGFRVLQLAVYQNPNRPSDSLVVAKIKQFDFARSNLTKDEINLTDSLAFWRKKEKLLKLPKIVQLLMPFPLSKGDMISLARGGSVALGCDGDQILIEYNKNRRFPETGRLSNLNNLSYILNKAAANEMTLISFAEPYAFIDHNGGIINPNSLVFKGAWSRNRVADLLPMNYEAPSNSSPLSDTLLKKDTILRNNIARVASFSTAHPVEKVYLHLSKPRYDIGDTIWFKAYTVIGEKHQLSALSGVLYAELVNPKDSVIKRLTLPLLSGTAWGDFALPRAYKPGGYHIRAYTNWMRNNGPEYFYNQPVQVGALQLTAIQPKQTQQNTPDVQFFPEGGQLVNGIRSRVAIKAVNANGLGEDIKGVIEDNQGNLVADFATQHLGMGVCALTPQSGKTYKAKISGSGEAGFTIDLPRAQEEGYTLAINNSNPDSLYIKIAVNEKLFNKQQNTRFYLIAQSGGKIYYTSAGKLANSVFTAAVEKKRFPSGIAQFTLFSQDGEPMSERIAFIQTNDTLKLSLNASATAYTTRQAVKISLNAADGSNVQIAGSFSVAVINESRVGLDEKAEGTIMNNLLLTSDLKGTIEQPNYYFTNTSDQARANLDVLMLTQGYRRFNWKQALSPAPAPIAYQPEKSLGLEGTLKSPSGKPVPNGKVTLVSTKDNILRDTVTDLNGNFVFNNLYLPDTAKLVLRARKEHNGNNVAIYLKQPDYPAVIKQEQKAAGVPPALAAIMKSNYSDYLQQQKDDSLRNGRPLDEVKINARKIARPDVFNHYGTVLEYDVDMKRLAVEFPNNIKESLMYVIPGMTYVGDDLFSYENSGPVRFIIDGFIRKPDDVNYFSPKEVENIRMIPRTGFDPPILILTTKRYAGTDTASTVKLKQVTIRANKIKTDPFLARSSNLRGGGNADQVIMGDKVSGCISISDCLIGKVIGVNFRAGGAPFNTRNGGDMSVIVDGIILSGVHLNDLNSSDIYSIEVLRSGAARSIYGSSIQGGGALIITMKHGGEDSKNDVTGDTTILKQVNIKGNKLAKKPELTHSDNLNGPGHADQVIMSNVIDGCVKLSDCLNGKIFGVTFDLGGIAHSTRTGNRLGQNGIVAASGTKASGSGQAFPPPPMVIIVDGSIMDPHYHIDDLNANDISSIEVLRSGSYLAIYGSNAAGGALVVTTKRGGETNYVTSTTPEGLITYPFKGFYKARTFYSPKYTSAKTDTQKPDMRNTIYWNPNLITGKDGKASFDYFNADTKGVYRVVVEGIDDNGNLGRQVYRYKVE